MDRHLTRILLIEDDEEDYILLQKLLAKIPSARYEVRWERTYEDGLAQMLAGEHDICMLDYMLGEYNGIDLLRAARSQGYIRPIILLTGASDGGEIDIQALQAGADDYITKGQMQGELLQRVIRYAIERKKAEIEREKLLSEQLAARELEKRRSEFISMVVHELKTPLTSLKGYAQLLRKRYVPGTNEQIARLAERMDSQVNKLTGLVDDFLDVTRITAGKLQFREEYFDFDVLVNEIIEELRPTTERHAICREGITGQTIWGDRMRVGQVITNFLSNAIKYAPETDRILVKTSSDGTSVTLSVQDFGPGVPKEEQANVFSPFYRLEDLRASTASGLGLGLHIAAEIIRRQEGQIWLESEEGKGATFSFTLPIDREHATSLDDEPDSIEQVT
jgi:signal transduction histidine kinase